LSRIMAGLRDLCPIGAEATCFLSKPKMTFDLD
jgi:hypothetical protein